MHLNQLNPMCLILLPTHSPT